MIKKQGNQRGYFSRATLVVMMIMSLSLPAFAQNQSQLPGVPKSGPRRQAAIVIFAGLGGAVLGLSTLSFYGRPQDKLSNIAIGAAVGVIVGVSYTVYKAATTPTEFYGSTFPNEPSNQFQANLTARDSVVSYSFDF
ncbi:MAG: hypothetical protein AB7F59_00825 [Bdellovibrionales bacterium]